MCTIFDGAPIPRLAEKNIVAYKVLERTKVKHAWETNIYDYNTPYRMMVVQFDMEYVQDQSCEFPSTKRRHGKTSVHGGAFHLFVRKKDADIEKNTLRLRTTATTSSSRQSSPKVPATPRERASTERPNATSRKE